MHIIKTKLRTTKGTTRLLTDQWNRNIRRLSPVSAEIWTDLENNQSVEYVSFGLAKFDSRVVLNRWSHVL